MDGNGFIIKFLYHLSLSLPLCCSLCLFRSLLIFSLPLSFHLPPSLSLSPSLSLGPVSKDKINHIFLLNENLKFRIGVPLQLSLSAYPYVCLYVTKSDYLSLTDFIIFNLTTFESFRRLDDQN